MSAVQPPGCRCLTRTAWSADLPRLAGLAGLPSSYSLEPRPRAIAYGLPYSSSYCMASPPASWPTLHGYSWHMPILMFMCR